MWWAKKPWSIAHQEQHPLPASPANAKLENHMMEITPRATDQLASNEHPTQLGRSVILRGDLSGKEDLLIEGQFDGTINLPEHCVTVGAHGQIKAEIHARQVVILGSVTGNVAAREKIEIRKTGQVVGDLVAATIAIEDGAYFKGSIDILREQSQEAPHSMAAPDTLKASV